MFSMVNKIGNSLTLPNDQPSVERRVSKTCQQTELGDAYLIGKEYTSDVNYRRNDVILGPSKQSN